MWCAFCRFGGSAPVRYRIESKGWKLEWRNVVEDVDAIEEITLKHHAYELVLRSEAEGVAGEVFQATGVALPPVLREVQTMSTTPVPVA